jgi:hypothetical protein
MYRDNLKAPGGGRPQHLGSRPLHRPDAAEFRQAARRPDRQEAEPLDHGMDVASTALPASESDASGRVAT